MKENYPCPCGGTITWVKKKVVIEGIDCGTLNVEKCPKCGAEYFPEETMEIVEKKLKQANLWGVPREEVRFWKSGNSLVVRIPATILNLLGIKEGDKAWIRPEGKHKVVIEA